MNRRSSYECRNTIQTSSQSSPSDEEVIQRRLRGQRRRMCQPKAADSAVDKDRNEVCDLLDIISRMHDVERDAEDVRGVAGIVTDNGLEESDEDSASTCSSIVSGPIVPDSTTPKKLCPPPDLCPACLTLYENAMMSKTPINDKLLDNDPTSLTCDQWVLLKKWTRRSNLRRKFLSRLQFGKPVEVRESPGCSRPHPFLQRNLRRVTESANKPRGRKSRKKRTKGSRKLFSAKRQRLHGENDCQPNGVSRMEVVSNTSQGWDSQAEADLSGEELFSSVTVKTSELRAAESKKVKGFRTLLSLSRGSMIVKE